MRSMPSGLHNKITIPLYASGDDESSARLGFSKRVPLRLRILQLFLKVLWSERHRISREVGSVVQPIALKRPLTATLASALAVALATLSGQRAVGDDCVGLLEIVGDEALAAEIKERISRPNVLGNPTDACPGKTVHVERKQEKIHLEMTDSTGRKHERTVTNLDAAVALIESCFDRDLTSTLLDPELAVEESSVEKGTDESKPSTQKQAREEDLAVSRNRELWLRAAGEVWGGFDASLWIGANIGGCVRLGITCLGATARYGYDFHRTGTSGTYSTRRHSLDGLVTLDFPLEWGLVTLVPGAGLGFGWVACFKEDQVSGYDIANDNILSAKVDAHLILSIALPKGLAFEIGASAGMSFFGHTGEKEKEEFVIASQPLGQGRGSLGLRYVW